MIDMNIPTHKKEFDINMYSTEDFYLVEFLESMEILPINYYDGVAVYVKCKTLVEAVRKYKKGGGKKNE